MKAHVAELHVAFDLGGGVRTHSVPIKPVTVELEYGTREDGGIVLKGCSGVVSKRSYVTLYRLVHILFPTMEAWQYSLDHSSQVTLSRSKAEEYDLIYMTSEDGEIGIRFRNVSEERYRRLEETFAWCQIYCLDAWKLSIWIAKSPQVRVSELFVSLRMCWGL